MKEVIFLKRRLMASVHLINNNINKPYIFIRNKYTQYIYNELVNDLVINENENYDYLGNYLTVKKDKPKNYANIMKKYNFDSKGICRFYYQGTWNYNPIQIVQFGLSEYGYYKSCGDIKHLKNVEKVVNWLIENQDKESGMWYFKFDYHHKNVSDILRAPWPSAMLQGQSISLLTRFYNENKDHNLLIICQKALKSFDLRVEEGGVLNDFHGHFIYEEYPTVPASYTLNGFIYSLFGLYDLYKTSNNERAKEKFEIGIKTLKKILPLYDDSKMTYYDLGHYTSPLRKPRQNSKYHIIHIKLLQNLNSILKDEYFDFYINKWRKT